jgi:hypothetical protein
MSFTGEGLAWTVTRVAQDHLNASILDVHNNCPPGPCLSLGAKPLRATPIPQLLTGSIQVQLSLLQAKVCLVAIELMSHRVT